MAYKYKRMGELLVAAGLITEEQVEEAVQLQKTDKRRLGTVLVAHGFITERQLLEALEMQLGVEFVDLTKTPPAAEMSAVLSKNIAKKYSVVPVKVERDELYLAMSDPLNFFAVEAVKTATRKRVVPMLATEEGVERAIIALYGNEGAARAIEDMSREVGDDALAVNLNAAGNVAGDDGQAAPVIRLVNSIIERAVTEQASDIHLEPRDENMMVRMRIDGLLRNILTIPRHLQATVLSRIKIMGGMDIAERKQPQDGRTNMRVKNSEVDLRISTLPTIYGEKVVIRLLDSEAQILTPEGIGLSGFELEAYNQMLSNKSGVILLTGPTGSGKSSTMYTMLHRLNTEEVNMVTLEDPVEYHMDGINQVQINEKTNMTFASGLRAILRQDPDIIAVGEIRDGETATIAMRAAITGHLVFSTIHTNDALSAIERLLDIGAEPYLIASALRGVISQRLVRRICPHCRKEYTPDQEELKLLFGSQLDETQNHHFYKGEGCPLCYGTGYRGRIGVFEMLMVDGMLRQIIAENRGHQAMMEALQGSRFNTLADNCRRLVLEGITTVEEAARTILSVEL